MQLRRLRLSAIGPFAGEFTIDFDSLGQSGLFLLEGPTGSGKSMLIDAIVFALYGKPASDQTSEERLRSHHAGSRDPSWVELVFETDAGIFRVHRTPAYNRAKSRGTGTTRQNATARLVRITSPDDLDSGEVISTAAQEVGAEITTLIGLTRAQFAQTVVLPQGEFAVFLRSKAEQRRKVLESIFRTGIYESITEELVDERKQALQQRTRAAGDISRAGRMLAWVTTHDGAAPDGLEDSDDPDALQQRAQELLTERTAVEEAWRNRRDEARRHLEAVQTDYEQRRVLSERLERLRTLMATRERLRQAQPSIDELRHRVRRARQAATVRSALTAQRRAHETRAQVEDRLTVAKTAFGPDAASMTRSALETLSTQLIERAGKLQELHDIELSLPERERELSELGEQVASVEKRRSELAATIDTRPERRAALESALTDAQSAANALPAAEYRAQQDARTLELVQHRDEVAGALVEHERNVTKHAEHARNTVDSVAALRTRKIQGMAGELAAQLQDGQACTVCGSTTHPAPAQQSQDHPDQEAIQAAEAAQDRAERQLADVREACERVRAEVGALNAQYASVSLVQAQADADEARSQLSDIRARAAQLHAAREAIEQFDAATKDLDTEHAGLREKLVALNADFAGKQGQLSRDRKAIDDALSDVPHGVASANISELMEDLRRRQARCEEFREALRAVEHSVADAAQCDADVAEALAASGFESSEQAWAAALPAEQIDQHDEQIRLHDADLMAVTSGLDDPELSQLTGHEEPELDAAAQAVAQAQSEAQTAQEHYTEAEVIATKAADAYAQLTEAIAAHRQTMADTAPAIRLAGIAEGSAEANVKKITLSSYVLLRRFEDVVKAANSRLTDMSAGRLSLVRSEEVETRGGRRTGLGLRVFDHVTASEREPRTLSGGETFYTSLSLALGLADVVTGASGGIRLGTLFIDEGFGTLDSETLDTVMDQLGALSAGGRLVGVVSHVSELKRRISEQINVRPVSDGSSALRLRGTDAAEYG